MCALTASTIPADVHTVKMASTKEGGRHWPYSSSKFSQRQRALRFSWDCVLLHEHGTSESESDNGMNESAAKSKHGIATPRSFFASVADQQSNRPPCRPSTWHWPPRWRSPVSVSETGLRRERARRGTVSTSARDLRPRRWRCRRSTWQAGWRHGVASSCCHCGGPWDYFNCTNVSCSASGNFILSHYPNSKCLANQGVKSFAS